MATIKFNKKTFEKEIGKLTPDLQQKIALFGTPLESITDTELEIDVTPNRPDLLSYQGFKRGILAFLGKKTGFIEYKINPPQKDYVVNIDSSLKDIRPFTACAIIKGLNFDDEKIKEIIDIQEKLHTTVGRKRKKLAIGIYPLEKIKLPITFKALEPEKIKFIPLESEKEMTGIQILQRHKTGRDYAHLLAGKTKFPIFIDANNEILSMPPIINSEKTGRITKDTKEIFIECSGFNFEILSKCLNIIVSTLIDMGGTAYQMELRGIKKQTPNFSPQKKKLSLENLNKTLGVTLTEKEIKSLLEKMGHGYEKGEVTSPNYRTDLLHEIDLIEDIAIAYGYDKFEPIIPQIATIGSEDNKETLKRKIREIISGLSILEISNLHLTTKKYQFENMGFTQKEEKGAIELIDSKTENNLLRKDLTHQTMKVFSENVDTQYPQKVFEIGKVFEEKTGKLIEKESLSIAITPGNFTELKQIFEYLKRMLNIELEIAEPKENSKYYVEGRFVKIKHKEKTIGEMGEIHPKILKNWKLKMPVAILEIELEEIFNQLI